ncbi:MAG: DEAD/DEAH box helicase [Pirellulales bacterium]|nr:DEAD/DEAH box helicase [Pirellulales bacterium]
MDPSAPTTSQHTPSSAREILMSLAENIPGVGRRWSTLLTRLHLRTVSDLLFNFPRDYLDLSDERLIADLEDDCLQSVRGSVVEVNSISSGFGKTRFSLLLQDSSGHLRANWFNQPFMSKKFKEGQHLLLTAKPKRRGLVWEMSHPQITWLAEEEAMASGKLLLPVYSLTEGLSQYHMRRISELAVVEYADVPEEVFPEDLQKKYELITLPHAIRSIHAPDDQRSLDAARRRFIFQELFILQLAISIRRSQQQSWSAPELPATAKIDARIRRLLPFELTESQNDAIREISADMALGRPMNRLLQGDVGSGKTIVALYAIMVAVAHGQQAALMAPTEILARQHAETLAGLMRASRVRYAVLAGSSTKSQRERFCRIL